MTMKQVVATLEERGHIVKYEIRNDGGIRITHIDGSKRLSGSTGNALAREMVGATLSETRRLQLEKIKTPKGKFGHKKLDVIPEDVKKQIRKAQRLFKKQGVEAGKPTLRKYRYNLIQSGKKEADRLLRQATRYALGLAYEENVDWLIIKLKKIQDNYPSEELKKAIKLLKDNKSEIRESWLNSIYELGTTSNLAIDVQNGILTSEEIGRFIIELLS